MAPPVHAWDSYRHHEDGSSWWCGAGDPGKLNRQPSLCSPPNAFRHGSVTDSCAMTPWRKGVHSSRAIASKALAGAHRTNYIDIQQVVKQSQPASMMTLDKLSPSFTGRIRISTVICYAFSSYCPWDDLPRIGTLARHRPRQTPPVPA